MVTQSNKHTIAILMMAYGSPESTADLEAYLLDIRGGRPTSAKLVEEIKERYELIGGRSPLLDLTRQQAAALERELNHRVEKQSQTLRFRTYVGMRHWEPRIRQAVQQIWEDGIRTVVALVMAPHNSRMSTGAYFDRLREAMDDLGVDLDVIYIHNWHDQPGLISAIAQKADTAMEQFEDQDPYVVFTAHSLPSRILEQGDPYDAQLRETAQLLAESLDLEDERWEFCYQSAGQSPVPWLGPQIETVITRLAEEGEQDLLVVPVGFVCDHVEVLYDIDIAGRKLAEEWGAHLVRSQSLNASPAFISALADLVFESLQTAKLRKNLELT
jgi:ferrochelatase